MPWLMFFRLNVSDAAAKIVTSSTPQARALEARQVRSERRVAHALAAREAREEDHYGHEGQGGRYSSRALNTASAASE